MQYTEEMIKGLFQKHTILKVTFEKKDKSMREMTCTRDLGLVPDKDLPKGSARAMPAGHLNVYELGVGWRSFHCERITEVVPCGNTHESEVEINYDNNQGSEVEPT